MEATTDIAERLEGVPDRLAKEALDEIVRLRWSLKTSQNIIDRLMSVPDSRTSTVQLTSSELSAIHFFSTYGAPAHRAGTLRSLLDRIGSPPLACGTTREVQNSTGAET
jgi:hypothetical protein